jgi:hypothetical protein
VFRGIWLGHGWGAFQREVPSLLGSFAKDDLQVDLAFPLAFWAGGDSGRGPSEVDVFEVQLVAAPRALMDALPVLHSIPFR